MLQSLHISNYALIDDLAIEFSAGLNIITGETGAGKSIILGALSLLLGDRADSRVVRDQSRKTVVEAVFLIHDTASLNAILAQADVDPVDESSPQCIIRREILPSGGRSRAFINDTPVNLSVLQQVASTLVDIHSQHQNLLLCDEAYQLKMLDCLSFSASLVKEYSAAYLDYRHALKVFVDTRDMINRRKADTEYISYQLERLDALNLKPGEQPELERRKRALSDLSHVKELLGTALESLSSRDDSAVDLLSKAAVATSSLDELIPDAVSLAERLNSALIEVSDIADTLRAHDDSLDADPTMLRHVEERLSAIYSLENRFNVDSSDELIQLQANLRDQLAAISGGDATLSALEAAARDAKKRATLLARKLSERRLEVAVSLADSLCQRARQLGLPNLECQIRLTPGKLSPSGIDRVQFLFSFNKNHSLMPVRSYASGGEVSRLAFALKSIAAEMMRLPTIIFDEVDSGISGDIANRMGRHMKAMGDNIQVITITHLPQIAAMGHTHFKVYKIDDENSTNTRLRVLQNQERVDEIALMLSGNPSDPASRAAAISLLTQIPNPSKP